MPHKLLFLLGGNAAFDVAAEEFVPAAGGRDSTIVLLMQGGRGWEKYVPEYTQPWIRRGASRYYPIAPDEDGTLDLDAVSAKLREATGIFIGGGPHADLPPVVRNGAGPQHNSRELSPRRSHRGNVCRGIDRSRDLCAAS